MALLILLDIYQSRGMMPSQTVSCPSCGTAITVDVPLGQQARLTHQVDAPDELRVGPRVQPITQPGVVRERFTPNPQGRPDTATSLA